MTEMNRRTFVTTVSAAAGAAYLGGANLRAASIPKVGMQLYTVRDMIAKDFDGTLGLIAAIGYKEVEFAGYFDKTPEQVRETLRKHGLTAPSAHIPFANLGPDKLPGVIAAAKTIGHNYIVCPWLDEGLRKDPDVWKKVTATLSSAGAACQKAGLQFAYHNHHFEYIPDATGKLPFDVILETCDPKHVKIELDLFWITVAGKDPLEYFKKYPGRFPLVHVKGMMAGAPALTPTTPTGDALKTITDVGSNDKIDWKRIFAQAKQAGIQHYFVEHDVPKSPLDSLKTSYAYLSKLQF
jgi:sugar phosphate isomerase/epimerase